jgi:hypothetical protein
LRYFLAYHNAKKMGYSCTAIPAPRVKTSKNVDGLEGATVWLVAGEGERPKSYYLASRFVIDNCEPNKYPGVKLCNEVSGPGVLLGTSVPLDGTSLLAQLQRLSANFVNGFFQLHEPSAIASLKALT